MPLDDKDLIAMLGVVLKDEKNFSLDEQARQIVFDVYKELLNRDKINKENYDVKKSI